jgi:hypothetical protein
MLTITLKTLQRKIFQAIVEKDLMFLIVNWAEKSYHRS